jgi:hypothetical protein
MSDLAEPKRKRFGYEDKVAERLRVWSERIKHLIFLEYCGLAYVKTCERSGVLQPPFFIGAESPVRFGG